jgi:hypothetical protein
MFPSWASSRVATCGLVCPNFTSSCVFFLIPVAIYILPYPCLSTSLMSFTLRDETSDLCSGGNFPTLLSGNDTPSVLALNTYKAFLSISEQEDHAIELDRTGSKRFAHTIIDISMYDPEQNRRLPCPAPPPKLHYTTFWKSVTKRIYYKRNEELQQSARKSSPKLMKI